MIIQCVPDSKFMWPTWAHLGPYVGPIHLATRGVFPHQTNAFLNTNENEYCWHILTIRGHILLYPAQNGLCVIQYGVCVQWTVTVCDIVYRVQQYGGSIFMADLTHEITRTNTADPYWTIRGYILLYSAQTATGLFSIVAVFNGL